MALTALDLSPEIIVTVNGTGYSTSRGTRVKNFLRRYLPEVEPDCLGAIVDNRLVYIEYPLADDCELIPVTYDSPHGVRIYRSTLSIMLGEAVARLFPSASVRIGQSFGRSFYYDVIREGGVSADDIAAIESEMKAMVARNEPLQVTRLPRGKAMKIFKAAGRKHSAELLKVVVRKWVPLVSMGVRV
ncbi:MAG TPA: hypothetical protein PKG82_07095, partial [Myxococcota bacterium]|nr:hypothetical protein [Myxococcota bacterium]